MKIAIAVILFSFFHDKAYAQGDIIIWNKTVKIAWSDYKGRADVKSPFSTISAVGIHYKYNYYSKGKVNNVRFTIDARFDRTKSWSKRGAKSSAILKHEQLHFDLAELVSRAFRNEANHTTYSKNYKNEIVRIFNRYSNYLQRLQSKYDLQTEHSNNKAKQQDWERLIRQELLN